MSSCVNKPETCNSLKEQLEYLRVSSKGAVVDGNKSLEDPVKQYLHIERTVEFEFEKLIENASNNDKSQLILLIGNVGDGKSHLLANLKRKRPELIDKFDAVHNDATASFKKSETYLDTLDKLLQPFNNSNIGVGSQKVILAINLGTLANFLEDRGENYDQLKLFISNKNIFSESIDGNGEYNPSSLFQFVNLTDFHLFSLSEDGPISDIIIGLLNRITNNSKDNPFFVCYNNYYAGKEWAEKCPIKFNYEFLMQDKVKEKFSKIISEAIIRGKMVISIRALLNFFYDALVPVSLANLSTKEYENYVKNISCGDDYLSLIIPNYIFENPEVSDILKSLNGLDPLISCSENEDSLLLHAAIDRKIIDFSIISNSPFVKKCIEKTELTKIIPRLSFFENGNGFSPVFLEYSTLLYHFYKKDKNSVKKLFDDTINSLLKWNGAVENQKYINVVPDTIQSQYRMSSFIELAFDPDKLVRLEEDIIDKFTLFFPLYFLGIEPVLKVDYELYSLIQKITKGYIPNYLDKRNHINVQKFIELAIANKANKESMRIKETYATTAKEFKLKLDPWGDFTFEEV